MTVAYNMEEYGTQMGRMNRIKKQATETRRAQSFEEFKTDNYRISFSSSFLRSGRWLITTSQTNS